ncbi:hypothetical protein GF337_06200 [candidate division KSB1 bacterium]|nr:hypothetical protein [candidate division KSB1 bacterium]
METLKTFFTFSDYYGFDYLTATCVMIAMFLLGSKNKSGFILYCVASTSGIVFAILAKSPPIVLTNIVMIIINVRGLSKWNKQ